MAPAPSFPSAVATSVAHAEGGASEAALAALALLLAGVALAGVGVVDRVRHEAGLA